MTEAAMRPGRKSADRRRLDRRRREIDWRRAEIVEEIARLDAEDAELATALAVFDRLGLE